MYPLLSALLNGLILATALTAAVGITLRLTPRGTLNAATRYIVWWVTLAAALAVPLSFLPRPDRYAAPMAAARAVSIPAPLPVYIPPPAPPQAAIPIHISNTTTPWPKWPLLLWPLISAVLLLRLAAGYYQLSRLKSRAQQIPAPRLGEWFARCKGTRKGIRLAVSNEIATPIATGPWRPAILIPARLFAELTEEDLDRIGLHETAHLVRRDDYALLFQRIVEALFIPSPIILWIARRIDLEREIACDDLVIAATGRPRSYADCLTRIVECVEGVHSPWPAATAAESVSQLARRVDALLDKTRRAGAHLMKARLAATTGVLLALALMASRAPALIAFVTTVAATARHAVPMLPLPAQTQTPVDETLAGQVDEENSGHPVAGAELRFHKPGLRELAADLETDRQGRFAAAGLPAGQYTVEVVKPNYAGSTFELSVPSPHLSVRLIHYGAIDGEVHNGSGEPMPAVIRAIGGRTVGSARLTILTRDPVSGRLSTFRETTPEEGGHYRVYDLPPGQYAVGFWYSGQNEGSGVQLYPDNTNPRFFSVAGGEEYDHIDFTVMPRPSAQVSGRIEMPEGVKGEFQLALGLPDQPNVPIAAVLSEKDGTFHFDKIPPGTYDLFAAGPVGGYTQFESILDAKVDVFFGRTRIQSAGQNVENLSVAVAPGKTIRLMVRGPAACPASVRLNLASLEPWAMMFDTATEATSGKELSIPKLAPGLFRIAAANLGKTCFQINDAVADLRGDQTEPIMIELAAAGAIHGKAGAPNATIVLTSLNPADTTQRRVAYSDATGQFTFESLPPGRYRIGSKVIEVAGGKASEVEVAP